MEISKIQDIENLVVCLAHMNRAMERLDMVPTQKMFTHSDKMKLKNFMSVMEGKAEKMINDAYENDEVYFQLLQQALERRIDLPVRDLINDEIQRLPEGNNTEGHIHRGEDGDAVPSNGGSDRQDPDSAGDSSAEEGTESPVLNKEEGNT